jgi:hypothetical protein
MFSRSPGERVGAVFEVFIIQSIRRLSLIGQIVLFYAGILSVTSPDTTRWGCRLFLTLRLEIPEDHVPVNLIAWCSAVI